MLAKARISNTTAAVATTTSATTCGEQCGIVIGGGVVTWDTSTYKQVIATKIVVIENGTNNTSTSISYRSSIDYSGAIINGTAVTTTTMGVYDIKSPYLRTANRTVVL